MSKQKLSHGTFWFWCIKGVNFFMSVIYVGKKYSIYKNHNVHESMVRVKIRGGIYFSNFGVYRIEKLNASIREKHKLIKD